MKRGGGMSSGANINATRSPAETVHGKGKDGNNIRVSKNHATTSISPRTQIDSAIATLKSFNSCGRRSGDDDVNEVAATILVVFIQKRRSMPYVHPWVFFLKPF